MFPGMVFHFSPNIKLSGNLCFTEEKICRPNKYILKCLILCPCPLVIQTWPFGGGLSQRSFHFRGQTPTQVSSNKKKLVAKIKAKNNSPSRVHSDQSRVIPCATGFGNPPKSKGCFFAFLWLPGLFFPYTHHKPTYHRTSPVIIPESIGLCWSYTIYHSFLCLLVECLSFLLPLAWNVDAMLFSLHQLPFQHLKL